MANVSKRTAEHLEATHDELERLRAYVRELEKDKARCNYYIVELVEIARKARTELGADTTPKMDGSHIGIANEALSSARRTLKRAIGIGFLRDATDNAKEGE
jgi:hypothetical protein